MYFTGVKNIAREIILDHYPVRRRTANGAQILQLAKTNVHSLPDGSQPPGLYQSQPLHFITSTCLYKSDSRRLFFRYLTLVNLL
jgi:hypothetical protein